MAIIYDGLTRGGLRGALREVEILGAVALLLLPVVWLLALGVLGALASRLFPVLVGLPLGSALGSILHFLEEAVDVAARHQEDEYDEEEDENE